jgi:ABC-2 type transport system ATP-binding protein
VSDPPLFQLDDPRWGRLALPVGGTVVLLGPSGAGKTKLVRSLLGLDAPLSGVQIRGVPGTPTDLAHLAGWVPEGDGAFLSDTVWENVASAAFSPPPRREDAHDALDLVGLAGRAGEPISALTRNGRRRVALARALASRRPLLVVDGELDSTIWPLFPGVLQQAPWVEGALLATARAAELAWRADSVALMTDGRVLAQAPLAEFLESSDPDVRAVLTWVMPAVS